MLRKFIWIIAAGVLVYIMFSASNVSGQGLDLYWCPVCGGHHANGHPHFQPPSSGGGGGNQTRTVNRNIQSVISIENRTSRNITYQVRCPGGSWGTRYTLEPDDGRWQSCYGGGKIDLLTYIDGKRQYYTLAVNIVTGREPTYADGYLHYFSDGSNGIEIFHSDKEQILGVLSLDNRTKETIGYYTRCPAGSWGKKNYLKPGERWIHWCNSTNKMDILYYFKGKKEHYSLEVNRYKGDDPSFSDGRLYTFEEDNAHVEIYKGTPGTLPYVPPVVTTPTRPTPQPRSKTYGAINVCNKTDTPIRYQLEIHGRREWHTVAAGGSNPHFQTPPRQFAVVYERVRYKIGHNTVTQTYEPYAHQGRDYELHRNIDGDIRVGKKGAAAEVRIAEIQALEADKDGWEQIDDAYKKLYDEYIAKEKASREKMMEKLNTLVVDKVIPKEVLDEVSEKERLVQEAKIDLHLLKGRAQSTLEKDEVKRLKRVIEELIKEIQEKMMGAIIAKTKEVISDELIDLIELKTTLPAKNLAADITKTVQRYSGFLDQIKRVKELEGLLSEPTKPDGPIERLFDAASSATSLHNDTSIADRASYKMKSSFSLWADKIEEKGLPEEARSFLQKMRILFSGDDE